MRPYIREVPGLLQRMHEDHVKGMIFEDLQRKYGYEAGNIRNALTKAGLRSIDRGNRGAFQKSLARKTDDELRLLAQQQKYIKIPDQIRWEWREWPLEKRGWFVGLMRAHINSPMDRPNLPFSDNVIPFDYHTTEAYEILKRKNDGKTSHVRGCKIKLTSQGVIWDDELWFWSGKAGYVMGVPWTKALGRPLLHHVIWERAHGPIPADCVLRNIDRNPNNLWLSNYRLETRNEVARENQAKALTRLSRARLNVLLKQTQPGKEQDGFTRFLRRPER